MPYRYCTVLLLAWLLACGWARARDDATDPSVVVERHLQHYVVEPGGAYELTVEHAETIVEQRAVQDHGQYTIAYDNALEAVLAVAAYTQKPDGRRVPVLADGVREQQEPASTDAPVFQDTRLKIVVFPEVAVGDRLVVRYVVRRHTPLFPGQFEDLATAAFFAQKNFLLVYDMPATLPLHADAVGFEPVPDADLAAAGLGAPAANRRRYAWRYVDGANERIEDGSVSYLDYGRRLAVSTFADYAAFAAAFRAGAQGRALPSPAIAALARQLAAGQPETRARVLALADWIKQNIRYVGVHVGPGGVVPHAAASVLDKRYGDCKDHAGLLEAMLAALGIAATPALVNSGNAYTLPAAPTLGVFDHMILYVPALDLFVDPTADALGPGYLPDTVLGKPVLLLASGAFAMTPVLQPQTLRTVATIDVGRDGRASFKVAQTFSGAIAEPLRRFGRIVQDSYRDSFVEGMLQRGGLRGHGVFDGGLLDGGGDDYSMSAAGVSDSLVALPGPGALATSFGAWSTVDNALALLGRERERRHDFVCPSFDTGDALRFTLPKGVRILALPRATRILEGGLYYSAAYTRAGRSVRVERRLTFRHGRATCTPQDYRAMRPTLQRIARDLRSQIVVAGR